jgi:putative oxidoreductase
MENALRSWSPQFLSVLRIMTGLVFLQSGTAKHLEFPEVTAFKNIQLWSLVGVAGVIELIGGTLIVLGLFTRPVAFLLSGEMAIAYFWAHAPRNFFPILNDGRPAILFCFVFLYLFFASGGAWSLDRMIRKTED